VLRRRDRKITSIYDKYISNVYMYHAVKACRILMNNAPNIPLPHNQREVSDFLHAQRVSCLESRPGAYCVRSLLVPRDGVS
jgi:hypothetical protein